MSHTFERSIVNTFHLNQQVQAPQLSSEEIAEIAVMKKLITNCFDNPDWDHSHTDYVARAFGQTFGGAATTAFLDVLCERDNNKMINARNDKDWWVITYFWSTLAYGDYGGRISGNDLLRMTEMLMRGEILRILSVYKITFSINTFGTTVLVPHLERILNGLILNDEEKNNLKKTIEICRSRP